jgi:hypothetical protein
MAQCPRYEMECPSLPCVRVCDAIKPKAPLRYPNLEESTPTSFIQQFKQEG